jgi:hypothetical protein
MVADCALWPEAVRPLAVSIYFLEAMLAGIVSENWAGTDVAISVTPIGSCPTTATWVKAMLAGEVTVTERVWPGLKMEPFVGEEI